MKSFVATLLTVLFLCALSRCALAMGSKPIMEPFQGMKNVTEWAHEIAAKDDIKQFDKKFTSPNEWFAMLERQKPHWGANRKPITLEYLKWLNKQINHSFKYEYTAQTYGKEYTATPNEILAKGVGDCKAAVTLKYFALAKLGFKPWEINIFEGYYVKGQTQPQGHRVLVVTLNGKFYVMDIMSDNVVEAKDYMNRDFMPKHRLDNKRVSIW